MRARDRLATPRACDRNESAAHTELGEWIPTRQCSGHGAHLVSGLLVDAVTAVRRPSAAHQRTVRLKVSSEPTQCSECRLRMMALSSLTSLMFSARRSPPSAIGRGVAGQRRSCRRVTMEVQPGRGRPPGSVIDETASGRPTLRAQGRSRGDALRRGPTLDDPLRGRIWGHPRPAREGQAHGPRCDIPVTLEDSGDVWVIRARYDRRDRTLCPLLPRRCAAARHDSVFPYGRDTQPQSLNVRRLRK